MCAHDVSPSWTTKTSVETQLLEKFENIFLSCASEYPPCRFFFFNCEDWEQRTATWRYAGQVDSVSVDNAWFGVVQKGTYTWQGVVGTTQKRNSRSEEF